MNCDCLVTMRNIPSVLFFYFFVTIYALRNSTAWCRLTALQTGADHPRQTLLIKQEGQRRGLMHREGSPNCTALISR